MRPGLVAAVAVAITAGRAHAQPAPATQAEVKAAEVVIGRWIDAQNTGDFTRYSEMYATGFSGVRRVGARVTRLDRAGWIKDRKQMFHRVMRVAASNLVVSADAKTLTVELDQRWEQDTFADVGKKRIVIDRAAAAAGDAAILSEQMLTSRVVPTGRACLRAVYPDAAGDRIGPDSSDDVVDGTEVVDPGGKRFVCRVDHRARGATDSAVELAVVKRDKGWTVLGQSREDLQNDKDPTTEAFHTGEVTLSTVPLTATDVAVGVTVKTSEGSPTDETGRETMTLYRVTADGLDELVEVVSTWASDVEDDSGTECALEVATRRSRGYPDLTVTCTITHRGDWWNPDVSRRGRPDNTIEKTRYRWNGTTYLARP